jgi:outer membrane lipoprotein-sorting protein
MTKLQNMIIIGVTSIGVCSASLAATQVERRNIEGKIETVIVDGSMARINTGNPNNYTVIDMHKSKMYVVDVRNRLIVNMDIIGKPPEVSKHNFPAQNPITAELVKKRSNRLIAGYSTTKYVVKVSGRTCSQNYFSTVLEKLTDFKRYIDTMSKFEDSRKVQGMPMPPCIRGHEKLKRQMKALGISMKMVMMMGKQGKKVLHEITDIKTNTNVPANTFNLPRSYRMISEQQMIEEQQAAMRQRHNPQPMMPPWQQDRRRNENSYY